MPGVLMRMVLLRPPASTRHTLRVPPTASRPVTAQPALPPPITI